MHTKAILKNLSALFLLQISLAATLASAALAEDKMLWDETSLKCSSGRRPLMKDVRVEYDPQAGWRGLDMIHLVATFSTDAYCPDSHQECDYRKGSRWMFYDRFASLDVRKDVEKLCIGSPRICLGAKSSGPGLLTLFWYEPNDDYYFALGKICPAGDKVVINLKQRAPGASDPRSCGLNGPVEARIKDCSKFSDSFVVTKSRVKWSLVARNTSPSGRRFYEVWKDGRTGLLWGGSLDGSGERDDREFNYYSIGRRDGEGTLIEDIACRSEAASRAHVGITERKFGIPLQHEYEQAEADGIREVLANNNWYWTGTSVRSNYNGPMVFVYSGRRGSLTLNEASFRRYIQCVGR